MLRLRTGIIAIVMSTATGSPRRPFLSSLLTLNLALVRLPLLWRELAPQTSKRLIRVDDLEVVLRLRRGVDLLSDGVVPGGVSHHLVDG